MTDGIIQKVIDKYDRYCSAVNYTNIDYKTTFREMKQELIEEIKKEAKENSGDGSWIECPIENLIGDNE
jgi:hypothetical protein